MLTQPQLDEKISEWLQPFDYKVSNQTVYVVGDRIHYLQAKLKEEGLNYVITKVFPS